MLVLPERLQIHNSLWFSHVTPRVLRMYVAILENNIWFKQYLLDLPTTYTCII